MGKDGRTTDSGPSTHEAREDEVQIRSIAVAGKTSCAIRHPAAEAWVGAIRPL
jgi:hypothetical protein